ncbi:sulfate adenylyltransferase [Streptomyces tsukubensis]|nr:sulfate adenylyltransferase [Streptomyces tsukubensis]
MGRREDLAHGTCPTTDAYATFAKEGGRVGSGALGAGTGGVSRCA